MISILGLKLFGLGLLWLGLGLGLGLAQVNYQLPIIWSKSYKPYEYIQPLLGYSNQLYFWNDL